MSIRSNFPTFLIALAGVVYIALAAHPYAGAWNDGSRLASVESLGDRGTFRIDQSQYADPSLAGEIAPYPADNDLLMRKGTQDKLLIDGHFYSDKTPIPGLMMAASYRVARWMGLPGAAERPDLFAWLMTVLWSGGAFLAALIALHFVCLRIGLSLRDRVLLLMAFSFATVNVSYVQYVNNHILMLGAAMPIFALLLRPAGERHIRELFWVGLLGGFAYTIDLGMGPPLVGLLGITACFFRSPDVSLASRSACLGIFVAGLCPFVLAHHIVNYQIAGTIGPANANPAFFDWPGCPFNDGNMTGGWKHPSVEKAILYSADMLVGKKGFLFHNLPLLAGIAFLLHRLAFGISLPKPMRTPVVLGLSWAVSSWLLYAASSNNLAGMCCSIRWFVPLLAPGFILLGFSLKEMPGIRSDLTILTVGGCVLGVGMAIKGPWTMRMIPMYWYIVGGTLATWGSYRIHQYLRVRTTVPASPEAIRLARAA